MLENTWAVSLKMKDLAIAQDNDPRDMKIYNHTKICIQMFILDVFI